MFHAMLFYFFATVLIAAALGVIFSRNPVHAVMLLVLAFFQSAVLWLLIEVEFLALVLVLVYVGAVMVLFLFVVMMLDINVEKEEGGYARYLPLGLLVAGLMVTELIQVIWGAGQYGHDCRDIRGNARGLQQHQGPWVSFVYRTCLRLRDCGSHFIAGDHCRDYVDDAQTTRIKTAKHLGSGCRKGQRPRTYCQDGIRKTGYGVARVIGLQHYLTLSAVLFALSIAGIFVNRRNLILLLMCIELMLLAVNFNFVAFSRHLGDETGQVFVFFILTVAAAEAAIGLAILVVLFRNRRSINVQELDSMKG